MVLITDATEMKSLPLSLRNSTARNEKDRQLSNFHIDADFFSVWQQITESIVAILSGYLGYLDLFQGVTRFTHPLMEE